MNALSPTDEIFLRRAVELAATSIEDGGGPFGAVVARGDEIAGEGRNRVVPDVDPTAHAEVVAIREACRRLGLRELTGCVLYCSCEPCPMCLGAAWWARVSGIVFAAGREDAAAIGFDDAELFAEVARPYAARVLPVRQALSEEARDVMRAWAADPRRVPY